jgi:antirestriction protein ArdC
MKADQIYTEITEKIIEKLEAGLATGEWTPPWHDRLGLPHNATTGKHYSGGNIIALWITEIDREYPTSDWATYRQWDAIGAQVRKGEKATHLIKWVEPSGKRDRAAHGDDAKKPRLVPVGFSVFNAAQVDGYVAPAQAPRDEITPIEHAEAFFAATGSKVTQHNEGRAFYSPGGDYIVLPPIADFKSAEGYYATLAHEHVHWTGAKSRLDREGITTTGITKTREQYAFEELIAELGSAFLGAVLGITPELRDDHVQYLRSWLTALKNDNKLLFKAATGAQKAVDFLAAFSAESLDEEKVLVTT